MFTDEIIELLRARAVVRRAGPRIYSTPGGNLTIPRATSASIAAYQGELDEVVSSQPAYDDLQLNAKKMTALVPVSNDLLRRPPVNLDEIIRDDFLEVVALREDIAFLTGDGSLGGPVGLVNHVPPSNSIVAMPITGMTNSQVVTTVVGLLRGMQAILRNSMSRMIRPTWIGGPGAFELFRGLRDDMGGFLLEAEMAQGKLLGCSFLETMQLPTNLAAPFGSGTAPVGAQLLLADFADIVVADTLKLEIDLSDSASYRDASANLVSGFTRDQTIYRAISEADIGVAHSGSLAMALLPAWVPPGYATFTSGSPYFLQAASGDGSAAPSTWGSPVTGGNVPGMNAAAAPGGTLPGRV